MVQVWEDGISESLAEMARILMNIRPEREPTSIWFSFTRK